MQAVPQWWPESGADVREAQGRRLRTGGRCAWRRPRGPGRPVFFRLIPAWTAPPRAPGVGSSRAQFMSSAFAMSTELLGSGSLIVMAVLARRNLRLGRGDRTSARRLAIGAMLAQTLSVVLMAHTPLGGAVGGLPQGLFFGLLAWLFYLRFEPAMRRAWPQLLIASTRLLDGRWRDPLVGRAVLAGILVGIAVAPPESLMLTRLQDLPGGGPTDVTWILSVGGFAKFLGEQFISFAWALEVTLLVVGILLVVRLLARRTDITVLIVVSLLVGWNYLMLLGATGHHQCVAVARARRAVQPPVRVGVLETRSARILYQLVERTSRVMLRGHSTCPVVRVAAVVRRWPAIVASRGLGVPKRAVGWGLHSRPGRWTDSRRALSAHASLRHRRASDGISAELHAVSALSCSHATVGAAHDLVAMTRLEELQELTCRRGAPDAAALGA